MTEHKQSCTGSDPRAIYSRILSHTMARQFLCSSRKRAQRMMKCFMFCPVPHFGAILLQHRPAEYTQQTLKKDVFSHTLSFLAVVPSLISRGMFCRSLFSYSLLEVMVSKGRKVHFVLCSLFSCNRVSLGSCPVCSRQQGGGQPQSLACVLSVILAEENWGF